MEKPANNFLPQVLEQQAAQDPLPIALLPQIAAVQIKIRVPVVVRAANGSQVQAVLAINYLKHGVVIQKIQVVRPISF
jgi:hypothetical protein